MNREQQLRLYAEEMGALSAARQVIASEENYGCCGFAKRDGHHPDCPSHPKRKAEKQYRKYHGDEATEKAT